MLAWLAASWPGSVVDMEVEPPVPAAEAPLGLEAWLPEPELAPPELLPPLPPWAKATAALRTSRNVQVKNLVFIDLCSPRCKVRVGNATCGLIARRNVRRALRAPREQTCGGL